MYLPPQGKEIDDDACLSQVNSLKEPGFHLECVVHREEAQKHFSCGSWVHTDPVLRLHTSTVALAALERERLQNTAQLARKPPLSHYRMGDYGIFD